MPPTKRQAKPSSTKIILTPEARAALSLLEHSHEPVFLTGRAGTGKSTLLQYFRANTEKKMVVLAPTGVAAVNVRGQTVHSFFGFGPDITVDKVRRRRGKSADLFQKLEAIVIDEISMVRADLLDCIDAFLRLNGPKPRQPFGGIQMIFVGDLYQLPPVVPPDDEEVFNSFYKSPYFFDARAFALQSLQVVELTRVWRQHDRGFVSILDAIRTASIRDAELAFLNRRCLVRGQPKHRPGVVHLVPTNFQADRINHAHLNSLPGDVTTFTGVLEGDFSRRSLPTSLALPLKPGSQIMMLANDYNDRFVNGDMGVIEDIDEDEPEEAIVVRLTNGYRGKITPYTWEAIRFSYDSERDRIIAETLGSFTQYPVRLAWALTIHKAQGQTFDRVVVDFGRGTFAHGQAYVALSRCRGLEGLTLRTPLQRQHLIIDPRIRDFLSTGHTPAPQLALTFAPERAWQGKDAF